MPIDRARPLGAIYDEVAEYDLVVVPDNPLADAIDRRVETPQFGTFATTPRRLATGRRETAEDRLAFLEVIDRTDRDWKAVADAVGNVLQCWEHEGTVDAVLGYDAYADETTREVVEIVRDLQTTSRRLTDYRIDADRSVAVVGYEQLTELERSILPPGHDRIDLFAGEPFDRPPFHVFDSSADVVDALLDTVSADGAGDVAVVLDGGSRYSSLVESALAAADVPYYGGPGFVDDPDHRALLQLLRTAFRGSDVTVADVRPLCARLGADVSVEHDAKRLDALDAPGTDWIAQFRDAVADSTFADAVRAYERETGRSLEAFRDELETLGLSDESLTRSRVEDLAYYLQTYEVPVDRENEGVLLADARSSGYVDRPVVFHLGMDEGWTHSSPRRPWVDVETQFGRYVRQFQLLLQSGTEQYYLVQDAAGGRPVTPCLYFSELLDEDFERFGDLESVRHTRPSAVGDAAFEKEPVDVEPDVVDAVSQSALNAYVNCPRDHFFGRLLDTPDQEHFREGNLFHDFAEFYVDHPEVVDEAAIDEIVDVMLDDAAVFSHDDDEPLRRRTYRIGVETIVEYLDENPPEGAHFLTSSSGRGPNVFADHFGRSVDSPLTEHWFENATVGVKGKIDLVRAGDHLVDHKSGRKKSAYGVVQGAAVDPPDDIPNFQAALYLCHFRTENPGERIEFTFFHFLATLDDVVTGAADLDDALTTVTYYPETFDDYVPSREAYDVLLEGYNDCEATFEDLGFEAYGEITDDLEWPATTEKEALLRSPFADDFTSAVDGATSDAVDAEKGCEQAVRALNGVRKRSFFREDLDAFEEFVADRIEEIDRRRAGEERFPVEGLAGEPNYRRVDHRDLLLEDEGGVRGERDE